MDITSPYLQSAMKGNIIHPTSAIMQSIDNPSLIMINQSISDRNVDINDLVTRVECSKLNIENKSVQDCGNSNLGNSFHLIDANERLKVSKMQSASGELNLKM